MTNENWRGSNRRLKAISVASSFQMKEGHLKIIAAISGRATRDKILPGAAAAPKKQEKSRKKTPKGLTAAPNGRPQS